jgi:ASC-1-like (ASCH) protein
MVEIRFRRFYNTFKDLLLHETLDNCLPGIDSIDEGLNVYYIQNYIDEKKSVAPLEIVAMGIKLIDEDDYLA